MIAGMPWAFALTRLLVSLVFEVSPTDPMMFTGASLLLTSMALLARRGAKVDPLVALKHE
jgi:putative ABC transport system permease protein